MDLNVRNVFFYFDPPYKPINETSSIFTSYDRTGFNDAKLTVLKEMCAEIHKKGWHFMMSNSDSYKKNGTSYFADYFHEYNLYKVDVTRTINPYNAFQRHMKEIIITNY